MKPWQGELNRWKENKEESLVLYSKGSTLHHSINPIKLYSVLCQKPMQFSEFPLNKNAFHITKNTEVSIFQNGGCSLASKCLNPLAESYYAKKSLKILPKWFKISLCLKQK